MSSVGQRPRPGRGIQPARSTHLQACCIIGLWMDEPAGIALMSCAPRRWLSNLVDGPSRLSVSSNGGTTDATRILPPVRPGPRFLHVSIPSFTNLTASMPPSCPSPNSFSFVDSRSLDVGAALDISHVDATSPVGPSPFAVYPTHTLCRPGFPPRLAVFRWSDVRRRRLGPSTPTPPRHPRTRPRPVA